MSSPRTEKTDQQRADELWRQADITGCTPTDEYLLAFRNFLSEVRREEREACAKIADEIHGYKSDSGCCVQIASAIRSRQENSNG